MTTTCEGSGRSPLTLSPDEHGRQATQCRGCQTVFVDQLPDGAVVDADITRVPDHQSASTRTEVHV